MFLQVERVTDEKYLVGTVFYQVSHLPQDFVSKCIEVESVPEKTGNTARSLFINPATKEMWYEDIVVERIDPSPTLDELQAQTLLSTELLLIYKEIGL